MSPLRRLLPVVALAGAMAGPALAADPGPVTTAQPGAGAPMSTAEQIDNYLKTSPAAELPRDTPGVTPGSEPRKVHGEAGVAVGSDGYRSGYVRSDIPVGQTGTVSIAVGETKFGDHGGRYLSGRYGPGEYRSLGLGLALSDGLGRPDGPQCRRAGEAGAGGGQDHLSPCLAPPGPGALP